MNRLRIRLAPWLFHGAALPMWVFLTIAAPQSTGWGGSAFRFVAAPLVLVGITLAVYWLVRRYRNAWGLAMLVAGAIAFGAVGVASWFAS